jgi:alanyl-tRNA synthetase
MKEITLDEAKEQGFTGLFESKYGERVKTYSIGEFSREICGGPHVENTGVLGEFKIAKEQSSAAGIRRIKAVLVQK